LSLRQPEISDTAVFDARAAGRWFEAAIRDPLDPGRPHKVSLVFDRWVMALAGVLPGRLPRR
jgi:hypothetical protein